MDLAVVPGKTDWAGAVVIVDQVAAHSSVVAGTRTALVDVCFTIGSRKT